LTLVVFDKNAAGPAFTQGQPTSQAFGPYYIGDVVDLTAGSNHQARPAIPRIIRRFIENERRQAVLPILK